MVGGPTVSVAAEPDRGRNWGMGQGWSRLARGTGRAAALSATSKTLSRPGQPDLGLLGSQMRAQSRRFGAAGALGAAKLRIQPLIPIYIPMGDKDHDKNISRAGDPFPCFPEQE